MSGFARRERSVIFRAQAAQVGYTRREFVVRREGRGLNLATMRDGGPWEGSTLSREQVEDLHAALGTWLEKRRLAEGR